MRMSSGPSLRNEKPRSAWSICIDDTPMSSTTPSSASKPCACAISSRSPKRPGTSIRRFLNLAAKRGSARDRIGIAVDGNDLVLRMGIEDGARIAACAERAVDEGAAALRIERRADLHQENGNVTGQSASGSGSWAVAASRHRSRSPGEVFCTVRDSTIRLPNVFFRSRTFVRASSRCARKRSGSQIWNL